MFISNMQFLWTWCSREVRVAPSSFEKNQLIFFANKCSWPGRNSFSNLPRSGWQRVLPLHVPRQAPRCPGGGQSSRLRPAGPARHRCRRKGGCQARRAICANRGHTGGRNRNRDRDRDSTARVRGRCQPPERPPPLQPRVNGDLQEPAVLSSSAKGHLYGNLTLRMSH